MTLREGGAKLSRDGGPDEAPLGGEYPSMHRRFVDLVREGRSEVDPTPLRLAADALLCGRSRRVEPFDD